MPDLISNISTPKGEQMNEESIGNNYFSDFNITMVK